MFYLRRKGWEESGGQLDLIHQHEVETYKKNNVSIWCTKEEKKVNVNRGVAVDLQSRVALMIISSRGKS